MFLQQACFNRSLWNNDAICEEEWQWAQYVLGLCHRKGKSWSTRSWPHTVSTLYVYWVCVKLSKTSRNEITNINYFHPQEIDNLFILGNCILTFCSILMYAFPVTICNLITEQLELHFLFWDKYVHVLIYFG